MTNKNKQVWYLYAHDIKELKRQTNQIEEYEIYKKRVESFSKAIDKREIKSIGNADNNK